LSSPTADTKRIPAFTEVCRNCGEALAGEFCTRCGQRHRHQRLGVRVWLEDLVTSVTNLESRVLQTVIGLTLRPGTVARDYVEGRQVRYVSPVRYALGTCAAWWGAVALQPEAAGNVAWWIEYGQLVNLASIPLLVPFVQVAFIGARYNYAEHLGLLLFATGHTFLWRTLLALLALTPLKSSGLDLAANIVDQVLFIAYFTWALWGFHRGRVRLLPLRVLGGVLGVLLGGALINLALIFWPGSR
jgi:hypothetical protein